MGNGLDGPKNWVYGPRRIHARWMSRETYIVSSFVRAFEGTQKDWIKSRLPRDLIQCNGPI